MRFTTVDKIVRRNLLAHRLPIHFYIENLVHVTSCLRELSFDSLLLINTVELPVNDYFAVDLPCDLVDWVCCGVKRGQFIQPITQRDSINPLHAYNFQGAITTYSEPDTNNFDFPFWPGFWMFQNVDDLGENTGRFYGYNPGLVPNGFKYLPERNQIQLTESFNTDTMVLKYISDGQNADNATQVDYYAQNAIDAYVNWKRSKNADIEKSLEGAAYYNQRRILRARKNSLTPWDIRQILFKNYRASIKN